MSIFSANVLDQKHILVTGATGGIGKETAKVLATMGASLTITGRNREKLEQARLEILEHTDEAHLLVKAADITNKEERENLVQCSLEQFGSFYPFRQEDSI
ncbi:MAG: SDR family NAD(P)-dependent oxidoreductase [Bacillota bacterium]